MVSNQIIFCNLCAGTAHGSMENPRLTFSNTVKLTAGVNKIALLSSTVGLQVDFITILFQSLFLHFICQKYDSILFSECWDTLREMECWGSGPCNNKGSQCGNNRYIQAEVDLQGLVPKFS